MKPNSANRAYARVILKKRIILVSVISFFLVLAVITSTILIVNKNKEKSSSQVPRRDNSPNDISNLAKTKTEKIAFLELKLSSDNIKINEKFHDQISNH